MFATCVAKIHAPYNRAVKKTFWLAFLRFAGCCIAIGSLCGSDGCDTLMKLRRLTMKKILLTAAFAVAVASPALAANRHHSRHNADVNATYAQGAPAEGDYAYAPVDAYTVVSDGKVIGRDPDVFIRNSLIKENDSLLPGSN
jgi:hypothetical protein